MEDLRAVWFALARIRFSLPTPRLAADTKKRMVEQNRRTAWYADLELRAQREAELRSEQGAMLRKAVILAERRRIRRAILWLLGGLGIALGAIVVFPDLVINNLRQ